jgi:CheY-like chemotaxis protein
VKTDPSQIEQVILNLVVNARDAMPAGGKLAIETANVVLDDTYTRTHIGVTPGDYVMLSVSDTGCGMSPEIKELIFEPFFTTKEEGKGTGLGLSTIYGIVKQSGGNIWVYSEPGRGTTFKIYLPRVEEETDALPVQDDTGHLPKGDETVLLVEDDPSLRALAARVLRYQGYKVLEATNGQEAIGIARENGQERIHLLLTDVVMPHMGGRELVKRMKMLHSEIRVLFISGYTDHGITYHAGLKPGTPFLQKPFSPTALAKKVREVLDQ